MASQIKPVKRIVTVEALLKVLNGVQNKATEICLLVDPDYDDIPLTGVMLSVEHGALFLIGSSDGIEKEEAIEGEVVVREIYLPDTKEVPEFDPDIAESA